MARSDTTFALFCFGLFFYYTMIVTLWLLLIIAVRQGGIVFNKATIWLEVTNSKPLGEFESYAPFFAAFVIVVAANFPWVWRLDKVARKFCVDLAGIPREANRLTMELALFVEFHPPSQSLREHVAETIEKISPQALRFEADGSLASRFTRAVGLYWLFLGPHATGMKIEFAHGYARSGYVPLEGAQKALGPPRVPLPHPEAAAVGSPDLA